MLTKRLPKWLFFALALVCISLLIGYFWLIELGKELPDIQQLRNVEYQIPLSVYSRDQHLLAQFGTKKRKPVDIDAIPRQLANAFIVAEDNKFYAHNGVDYKGLLRAAVHLILSGEKKQGGSTITMQVTRNFFLTREKTYIRKLKEIILALRIEQSYSKDHIMELYLNKIYLGHRSYGVIAAALTYYNRELAELSLAQFAMLAGLPKAPSLYNPVTNPTRALQRRNYILQKMFKLNYIDQLEFERAINAPISATIHGSQLNTPAPYIAEMVRQEVVKRYGEKAFTAGLKVYTTIDSELQVAATRALRSALHDYDQRHGYRSLPHLNKTQAERADFSTIGDTKSAHVIALNAHAAIAQLADNSLISIAFEQMKWARKFKSPNSRGAKLTSIHELLKRHDLIKVRQLADGRWSLSQLPDAEAAFVALNSHDGAILALAGGFDFFHNKYNRVIQSKRQPGSGFKPIIYTAALEGGFTVADLINDAPVVVDNPTQESEWRPENYSKKFFGMTPLRTALRQSRNLISIRLLRTLGLKKVTDTALRFGFKQQQLPKGLSLALGSGYANPLQMATVFSVFDNGGFLIKPYFIERIEDSKGTVLFRASPPIVAPTYVAHAASQIAALDDADYTSSAVAAADYASNSNHFAPRIISARTNFLMNSLLRDVVQRGTARKALVLKRTDLAGKTGTTNEQRDAWFNGYGAGIAASAWLGFDTAKPLGRNETGGKAALPIWIDFMKTALKNKPEQALEPPRGISQVYIDPKTGKRALHGGEGIWEFFKDENIPTEFSKTGTATDNLPAAEEDDLF